MTTLYRYNRDDLPAVRELLNNSNEITIKHDPIYRVKHDQSGKVYSALELVIDGKIRYFTCTLVEKLIEKGILEKI